MNVNPNAPTVSVVMPVYNGEPYLGEAVESILNQTFTDFEFIIIDDGSTDNTWSILQSYAARDKRIILQRNPENLRIIKTLNKGMALTRGEFIARHDADDIALPGRLTAQVGYLQCHPEAGLVGTAYYRLYDQGQRSFHQPPLSDTEARWQLLFDNIWPHDAIMFRRRLLQPDEPFYKHFLHVEDYELWTRLMKLSRAATLPDPLIVIRTHKNSGISATHKQEMGRMKIIVSTQQINDLFSQRPLSQIEIESLHRCYRPQQLTEQDMALGGRLMIQLFNTFMQQPGIEASVLSQIRRRWIKQILAATALQQWGALWVSGLFPLLLRHEPQQVLLSVFAQLFRRTLRQLGQYAGIQRQANNASSLQHFE